MLKPILFLDRDGTILVEPTDDFQIKSLDRFHFMPFVIDSLLKISKQNIYHLVLVTNQDGLGTDEFPLEYFVPYQDLMMDILSSQGIQFLNVHIDRSKKEENSPTRKPGLGMLQEYISKPELYDLKNSIVIGDRRTDIKLATNIGCSSILIENELYSLYNSTITETEASTILLRTSSWKTIEEFLRNLNFK